VTTWVRVDCDVPTDERLLCTGHALYWPAILTRAKARAGHLTALAANPVQLAHLWGSTVDAWSAAIEHFIRVGMLTRREDGDGYDVEDWRRTQVDPTNAERQKRHRQATKGEAVTRDSVTVPLRVTEPTVMEPLRVTLPAVTTVQDSTRQDRTQVAADAAPPRTQGRAHEAAATAPPPDGLAAALERWRLALRGRSGAAPLVVGSLDAEAIMAAVNERGAEYVTRCIDRAAEVAGGSGPSLALLGRIVAEGIHDSPRPVRAPSGGRSAPAGRKSVNAAWANVQESSEEGERW
jgi:hypothetical protein